MKRNHTYSSVLIALNFSQSGDTTDVPEWIEIIPAGEFDGRDGRAFSNSNPSAVIAETIKRGVDIPFDIEHATEVQASEGNPAPAQSWINCLTENFEIRDGAIFGRVDWKPKGLALVQNHEYRYYSPAFYCDPKSGKRKTVTAIKSIGFTNTPNLSLTALNHEEHSEMDLSQVLAALGLNSEASPEAMLVAINALKDEKLVALNRAETPDATKFIPKGTHDLAINRAETAEQKLAEHEKAATDLAINSAIDGALKDGKIAPADKDFYMNSCKADGGLESFNEFIKSKAPIVPGASGIDEKDAPAGTSVALNAEQKYAAGQMGMTEAEYKEELKSQEGDA